MRPDFKRLHEVVDNIVSTQAGIPETLKGPLIERLMRAIELSFTPENRREGVTVMTEAASLSADKHLERRRGLGADGGEVGSTDDPKPKTV